VRILRQKYGYVAWLVLHFLLIISVSCRETLRLIAQGPTILPSSFKSYSQEAETTVSIALGRARYSENFRLDNCRARSQTSGRYENPI
jgi:hypothetical protein